MKYKVQKYDQVQISAISRLFSPSVFKEMARRGKSPLFARLAEEGALQNMVKGHEPISKVFDTAFNHLKQKSNRNEYIYKAAITHKVLLGIHSLTTAAMLTEYRTGSSKADVVILNGTSTVYEIKSERDNLDRLQLQIEDYRRIFSNVNVIAGIDHAEAIIKIIPHDVGILSLTDRYQISTLREAKEDVSKVEVCSIFDSVQLKEAKMILQMYQVEIPKVANTQMYDVVREKFLSLSRQQAHSGMVEILKKTRNLKFLEALTKKLPSSLLAAALSAKVNKRDFDKVVNAVNTPYGIALNWR